MSSATKKAPAVEQPKKQAPMLDVPERLPAKGEWVFYWQHGLRPESTSAQVMGLGLGQGHVHLNIHGLGYVTANMNTPYSASPKVGCWSWKGE